MLYSLLLAVLILSFLMAFLVPYCVIRAFLTGFNITARAENKEPIKAPKTIGKIIKQSKAKKESDVKIKKAEQILSNLDRFDGTPKGQVKI